MLVIQRGEDAYEIIKDNMLPPDFDIEQLYYTACENLARDIEFVVSNTWYGGFGIVADGHHEASSLCLQHIWNVCAEKLDDDLCAHGAFQGSGFVAPAKQEEVVGKMIDFGKEAYERSQDRISTEFDFTKDGKELLVYDKMQH